MRHHQKELEIYFDNKLSSHRKTKALAYSITHHVKEIDYDHYKLTKLMWSDLLVRLEIPPKQLLNKADPKYQKLIAKHDFDDDDWLEILVKNPDLIKAPIVLYHDKAVLCENPKDIYKIVDEEELKAARHVT